MAALKLKFAVFCMVVTLFGPLAAAGPQASDPSPADGAVNVPTTAFLSWTEGDYAVQHDIYFGTDQSAVANANTGTAGTYRGRQTDAIYNP